MPVVLTPALSLSPSLFSFSNIRAFRFFKFHLSCELPVINSWLNCLISLSLACNSCLTKNLSFFFTSFAYASSSFLAFMFFFPLLIVFICFFLYQVLAFDNLMFWGSFLVDEVNYYLISDWLAHANRFWLASLFGFMFFDLFINCVVGLIKRNYVKVMIFWSSRKVLQFFFFKDWLYFLFRISLVNCLV